MKSILAKVCTVCPVCNLVRKNPGSKLANIWRKVEKVCPFCRAYYSMHQRTNKK